MNCATDETRMNSSPPAGRVAANAACVTAGASLIAAARAHLLAMCDDDHEFADEVLGDYATLFAQGVATIREQLQRGDDTGASREVHSLKGASLNVGLEDVGTHCKNLELCAKTGNRAGALAELEELVLLEAALSSALSSRDAGGTPSP